MTKNKILKIFAFIIINLTILSCQNSKHKAKEKPAITPPLKSLQHNAMKTHDRPITSKHPRNSNFNKIRELDLKPKEIKINEKENWLQRRNGQTTDINWKSKISNKKKQPKKLRYLFFANGGITGYYNNNTYTGCPRCDFCKSNILNMYSAAVAGTYVIQHDGSLLLNNGNMERPTTESNTGSWALINYKWHIKPPQY